MEGVEIVEVKLDTDGVAVDDAFDAHEFEKRLIGEIKKRPFLYDYTLDDFKDSKRKDDAWVEIAESVGKTVPQCQCRWKSLRDKYVRQSRKIRTGNGPKRHLWAMTQYLHFLDIIPRTHRERNVGPKANTYKFWRSVKKSVEIENESSSSDMQLHAGTYEDGHVIQMPELILPDPVSAKSPPPACLDLRETCREKLSCENTQTRKVPTKMTKEDINFMTTYVDMADGCSAFGMSISATLRTLGIEQQEQAKLKIQQVLYEVQLA